jgi:hypothetical protein
MYDQYKYCGYINVNLLENRVDHEPDHCLSQAHIPPARIAGIINCDACTGGNGVELRVPAIGYRNIRPWGRTGFRAHVQAPGLRHTSGPDSAPRLPSSLRRRWAPRVSSINHVLAVVLGLLL